jgi:hypothetical protein
MGFITVLKLLTPLSNIVQCCSDHEQVGVEIRVGVNFIRAVNMDGNDEG